MQTLKQFLAGALITLMVILAGCGARIDEAELMQRAQQAADAGDTQGAVIDLKTLLSEFPENRDARLLLGRLYLQSGDPASAEKELRNAVELGVDENAVIALLARSLLQQGKYEQVVDFQPSFDMLPEDRAHLYTVRARALMGLEDTLGAMKELEQALALVPDFLEASATRAAVMAEQDRLAAREILEAITRQNPEYVLGWWVLGQIERMDGAPAAAEAAFTKAIELEGSGVQYLSRAMMRIQLGKTEAAQSDIEKARSLMPGYFEVDFAQSLVFLSQGRLREARSLLDGVYGANDEFQPAKIYLAEVEFKLGNLVRARALVEEFLSESPDYLPGVALYASILNKTGEFSEAEAVLKPLLLENPENFALLGMLADSLRGQNKQSSELDVLHKMLKLQPKATAVMLRIGDALLASDSAEGVAMLRKVLELEPANLAAAKELIAYYSKRKEYPAAAVIAGKTVRDNPQLPGAHILAGLAHVDAGAWDKAQRAFEDALALAPADPTANQNLAALAIRNQDYNEARKRYDAVLKEQPAHVDTLLRLARLHQLEQRDKEMLQVLDAAMNADPDAIAPRLMLAQHQLQQDAPSKVLETLRQAQGRSPADPRVLELLGRAHLKMGDQDRARDMFSDLTERAPDYAEGHFLLSQPLGASGNTKAAVQQLLRTIELEPQHFLARLNLAQVYSKQGKLDAARMQLLELQELAPDNVDVQYLEANLARLSGNQEEALRLFQQVFEKADNTESVVAVAQQEWNLGRKESALQLLEGWVGRHGDDVSARIYLAGLYTRSGREADAVGQYEKVLAKAPENLLALNNLAWALRDTAPKKALEYAERAFFLAKTSRQVADTYAITLMKNKDFQRALRLSDIATADLAVGDGQPLWWYHRALILDASGRKPEAKQLLQSLLSSSGKFSERAEAEALLKQI